MTASVATATTTGVKSGSPWRIARIAARKTDAVEDNRHQHREPHFRPITRPDVEEAHNRVAKRGGTSEPVQEVFRARIPTSTPHFSLAATWSVLAINQRGTLTVPARTVLKMNGSTAQLNLEPVYGPVKM